MPRGNIAAYRGFSAKQLQVLGQLIARVQSQYEIGRSLRRQVGFVAKQELAARSNPRSADRPNHPLPCNRRPVLIENVFNAKYYTFATFSPTSSVPMVQVPGTANPRSYSFAVPIAGTVGIRVAF